MTTSDAHKPGHTIERKQKRRGASTTTQDDQSVETPRPTYLAFPSLPRSEPAILTTRNLFSLPTSNSTPSPSSAGNSSSTGPCPQSSESVTNATNTGIADTPRINVFDVTDPGLPPGTPCPTCHRRGSSTSANSPSPSPTPSPNGSFGLRESDSDTSLDISSLSLNDGPVPLLDFQRKNAGPLERGWIDLKVFEEIRREALDPESAKRGEDGYVYILEDKNQPGYVKIGQTSKNPHDRSVQINRCKKVCTELVKGQNFATVPCYKRLERIIFADLWNERRCFLCERCGKRRISLPKLTKHGEWLQMSKEDALARVALWKDWMRRNPYDDRGVLKPEWQKRIQTLEADVSFDETVDKEHASGKWWETFMKEVEGPSRLN